MSGSDNRITVIDPGVSNLASLRNAIQALDIPVTITSDPGVIEEAEKLILPGVGAFAPAISRLQELELRELIVEKAESGTPLLGICLGMQLLFTTSYENGRHAGLDLIPGEVVKFSGVGKIPHMGWNSADFRGDMNPLAVNLPDEAYFYFVHSYYCVPDEPDDVLATCSYGTEFAASVNRGNVWGVQFHPEKSQKPGLQILKNFAEMSVKP